MAQIDIPEEEVRESEATAPLLKDMILRNGSTLLINIVRTLPPEAFGELQSMFDYVKNTPEDKRV